MDRDHTWIIGGTGMLAGAVPALSARAADLTLVARTRRSLDRLAGDVEAGETEAGKRRVHLLPVDWDDRAEFLAALHQHAERHGAPTAVVAWLHDLDLGPEIARTVCTPGSDTRFLQVCGSRTRRESLTSVSVPPGVDYRWVILGSISVGGSFRWLTHAEIVAGVLDAWTSEEAVSVVGTLNRGDG